MLFYPKQVGILAVLPPMPHLLCTRHQAALLLSLQLGEQTALAGGTETVSATDR